MTVKETCTYEKVYLALWETGQRYGKFAQFRVIGRSHDDRMIPMLEIGKGDICIFCVSGIGGKDYVPALSIDFLLIFAFFSKILAQASFS